MDGEREKMMTLGNPHEERYGTGENENKEEGFLAANSCTQNREKKTVINFTNITPPGRLGTAGP